MRGIPEGKCTEGGWEWYLRQLKEKLDRPLTQKEYSDTMRLYIVGTPVDEILEELE